MSKQQVRVFCTGVAALFSIAIAMSACGGVDQISQVSSTEFKTKNAALVTRTTIALPPGCYKTSDMYSTLICPPGDPKWYVRPVNPKYNAAGATEGQSCTLNWNFLGGDPGMAPGKNAQGQTDDFVCWLSTYVPEGPVNPVWYRESTLIKAAQAK